MSILALEEIASCIFLFSDLETLLSLRSVSRELKQLVRECVPLLCARDQLPIKKDFFHWALMHSATNNTRYSSFFQPRVLKGPSWGEAQDDEQLLELLHKKDFETVEPIINSEMLSSRLFTVFFDLFGESDVHLSWLEGRLKVIPYKRHPVHKIVHGITSSYHEVFCGALDCKYSAKVISKIWWDEMRINLSKETALRFVKQRGTLEMYYTVETIYPDLNRLEECLASPSEKWIAEYVAANPANSETLFTFAFKENNFALCNYLDSLGASCLRSLTFCNSLEMLQWSCDRMGISSDSLICKLLLLGCTAEQLAFFLDRYGITETYPHHLANNMDFHQFEVILSRLSKEGGWYTNTISNGFLLLLTYYDRERFSLSHLVETSELPSETLRFLLERDLSVDWTKLVETYLYMNHPSTEIFSLLLQKDMERNNSDFQSGLPERWKYNPSLKSKAYDRLSL